MWKAFDAARDAGRSTQAMPTAVLKNRILTLTSRHFREVDYGADSFLDLLKRIPDVIEVRKEGAYNIAVLKDRPKGGAPDAAIVVKDESGEGAKPANAAVNLNDFAVRPDLWDAVVDFSSGSRYWWADGRTVTSADPLPGSHQLPTLTEEEERQWRRDFAAEMSRMLFDPRDAQRLEDWTERGLGSFSLPGGLRRLWNVRLKLSVGKRLSDWFAAQGLTAPEDLLVPSAASHAQRAADEEDALREFIVACVSLMTTAQMRSLNIPVDVAMKVGDRSRMAKGR